VCVAPDAGGCRPRHAVSVFGLDEAIAGLPTGGALAAVLVVALLLGLRHATDPDHLAAVTTLSLGDGARPRSASALGLAWAGGHTTSLFVFGLPIVLWRAYLPEHVQRATEVAVGGIIVALALWLLLRWFHGRLDHGSAARSRRTAYAIGLVHGMGGSAGVGVLLLAAIPQQRVAFAGLVVFAFGTAVSMAGLSAAFGRIVSPESSLRLAPYLGIASLAFGVFYAASALGM
jgi:high-affinity nickel permease